MNKRFLSVVLCLLMVFSAFAAAAASFPDVEKHWANKEIQEMAGKKIIAGFEDGTFRPENSVTRVDSLLLVSRIIGASESALSDFVDASYEANYADVNILGYKAYEKNLAYLLYKGIYTPSELRNFIGNKLGSNPLKRHEAAVILIKLIGKEAEAKANAMPVLSYADSKAIPASAKAYVELCETTGLMKGMEDNKFNPDYEVTRAQMAVMLYRAMECMGTAHSSGTITEVNHIMNTVTYTDKKGSSEQINILSDTTLRLDGGYINNIDGIEKGFKINVVTQKSNVAFVEFLTQIPDEEVSGIFVGSTTSSNVKKISVKPVGATENKSFTLADDCVVTINGTNSAFTSIPKDCFVKVTVKNNKAAMIVAENKTKTVSGIIKNFIYGDPSQIVITLSNNTTESYELAKSVTIKRNNSLADASELMVGDRVSITLTYNQISSLTAQSSTRTVEGTIEEIIISANPSIKIKTSSGVLECALNKAGLEVNVNGEASDVYGLRLGYLATVKMESSTITKIDVSSVATPDTLNIVGVVEHVDTNYYFIQLTETSTGESKQVFVKKNATIIDGETQKTKTLSNIKEGSLITVVVTSNGFTPEAISIVILPNK